MARLFLLRHAPTPDTGTRLTGRLAGVGLGEEGRLAAKATADRLADVPMAAIYASPLERTWETAEIVAAPHGITPVVEEGLIEVDYGSWSGRTLRYLSGLKAWRTVQVTPSRMVFPGGEGLAEAQQRAVSTCERLAGVHRKRNVALVSHADIIKAILSHYLGQPLDLFQRIVVAPASVSVVDLPDAGVPSVLTMNSSGGDGAWR